MGDIPHYFDIILFAMVAGFLILRLRAVLGRRTGDEQRPRPVLGRPEASAGAIVPGGIRSPVPPPIARAGDAVAAGLGDIHAAAGDFDPAHFLEGARAAFDMIVGAFAAGDKPGLRPLLSDEVYSQFVAAIDERLGAGETLETRILQMQPVDITDAKMVGRVARITVKFISDQINVLRAHDGSVVDGDPDHAIQKIDFWSFSRDVGSSDPNWVLVATASG